MLVSPEGKILLLLIWYLFLEEVRGLHLTTEILHALLFPSLKKNLDDFIPTFCFLRIWTSQHLFVEYHLKM
jgi:hypothetical protein